MAHLTYRNAVIEDLPIIVDIYNSTIESRMVTADIEPVTVESKVAWFGQFSNDKRPLWVIEDETADIVGWVGFQSFYGRAAYDQTVEISIYLHPSKRSKGVGKQVLAYCIHTSPNYGIKTLLGFIFGHNIPSIKLFENLGFEVWGTLPNVANLDGIDRTLKILGKRVN